MSLALGIYIETFNNRVCLRVGASLPGGASFVAPGGPGGELTERNKQKRKASALLEGKSNLLRMRQEIPLSDAELAALDDGVSALEPLLSRLADVPTPAGPTPLQLRDTALVQIGAAD